MFINMKQVLALNIKRLRMERGWSAEKLAGLADVSVGYIRQIESGRKFFGPESFQKWADVFGVDSQEFLRPPEQIGKIISYRIPVLSGIPLSFPHGDGGIVEDYLNLPEATPGTFAVRVRGENMAVGRGGIQDGDYALFVVEEGHNGDIVVVVDQHDNILVRRLKVAVEGPWLHSDSPDYPARPLAAEDRIVGKVTGCWRKVKI